MSRVDITAAELFGTTGRTLATFFEETGRAEVLWYPLTERPWLKYWQRAPRRPLLSRPTSQPYNYAFSDNIPPEVAELARTLVTGNTAATPLFSQLVYGVTAAGLVATASADLWGPAMATQLYIKATTLRVHELGIALLTSRARLQEAVIALAGTYGELVAAHASRGSYPVNMPFELRASALDQDLGTSPILTATSPDPSRPDLDVVLYTNPLALTGTPGYDAFCAEYLAALRPALSGGLGVLRAEWSKDFAHTAAGPETDLAELERLRQALRDGRAPQRSFDGAARTLARLDPAGVFTNDFVDQLLGT